MGHGRKFKQIRLCADFSAGPSKEYSLLFLLAQVRAINIKKIFFSPFVICFWICIWQQTIWDLDFNFHAENKFVISHVLFVCLSLRLQKVINHGTIYILTRESLRNVQTVCDALLMPCLHGYEGKCHFTIEHVTQYNKNVNWPQVNVSRVNTASDWLMFFFY